MPRVEKGDHTATAGRANDLELAAGTELPSGDAAAFVRASASAMLGASEALQNLRWRGESLEVEGLLLAATGTA